MVGSPLVPSSLCSAPTPCLPAIPLTAYGPMAAAAAAAAVVRGTGEAFWEGSTGGAGGVQKEEAPAPAIDKGFIYSVTQVLTELRT